MSEFQLLSVCRTTKFREINLEPDIYAGSADINITNKANSRKAVHRLDASGNYSIKVYDTKTMALVRDVLVSNSNLGDQQTRITALELQVAQLTSQLAAMQALLSKLDTFAKVIDDSIAFEGYSESGGYNGA